MSDSFTTILGCLSRSGRTVQTEVQRKENLDPNISLQCKQGIASPGCGELFPQGYDYCTLHYLCTQKSAKSNLDRCREESHEVQKNDPGVSAAKSDQKGFGGNSSYLAPDHLVCHSA